MRGINFSDLGYTGFPHFPVLKMAIRDEHE
jgi:hypothetical protein